MKKIILLLSLLFVLPSCANIRTDSGKPSVIATLFPQYDFCRAIAGDKMDVSMLIPRGAESHTYEPTPTDRIKLDNAGMLVYAGHAMEPWIEKLTLKSAVLVDTSAGIPESHEDHDHEFEPHFWTSPVLAGVMADTICAAFTEMDPENSDYYKENTQKLKSELNSLDEEFRDIVKNGTRKKIIFGGRFAFHFFTDEYGLEWDAAYDSCSAEAEPSIQKIGQLVEEIKRESITVIYYEELTDPAVARSIGTQSGAKPMLLHSCHNVTQKEFADGITYVELMRRNAINLKEGLS